MPNKAQFVELLAERLDGDRKKAQSALDAVIDTVYQAVSKGERVVLTGFGVFEKRDRAARTARNPATGATVKVKKTSVPAFRAGAEFKAITSGAKKLAKAAKAPAKKASAATSAVKSAARSTTKSAAGRTLATKSPAKSAPAKRTAAKTLASKSTASKSSASKAPAKKAAAKKAPAKKSR